MGYPTVAALVINENYEGTRNFVEAGADLFAVTDSSGFTGADMLAGDEHDEHKDAQMLMSEFIDEAYFSNKAPPQIKRLIVSLDSIGPLNSDIYKQRNAWAELNAEKLLYQYPKLLDDEAEDSFINRQFRSILEGEIA